MVTTILQIYKRPGLFDEQYNSIINQTIKSDEIFVIHNEGGVNFDLSGYKDIKYIYANPNQKYHLRFAVALLAKNENIAFFDDDTIPGDMWYENCLETIKKHDCLCVSNGRVLNKQTMGWDGPGWCTKNQEEVEVDFGGHAWFLRKENLKYMWQDEIYEYNNGEDIQLSANLQIYGKIPTFVPPHPSDNPRIWGSGPNAMKYGSDSVASWIANREHFNQRNELVNKYISKGWKLTCMKI